MITPLTRSHDGDEGDLLLALQRLAKPARREHDAPGFTSIWPASVAAEHKEPAWNQCARDSDHVFERGGEKATVFLPVCLGDEEIIHLRGNDTRR